MKWTLEHQMTERMKQAMAYRESGYNCAQAVFAVFSDVTGMPVDTALKVASGFGGGVGRRGELCGAVTGGVMSLGMIYGDQDDLVIREKVNMLCGKMESLFGNLSCRILTGVNLQDEEERSAAKEAGVFDTVCRNLVLCAVETVEEMIKDKC